MMKKVLGYENVTGCKREKLWGEVVESTFESAGHQGQMIEAQNFRVDETNIFFIWLDM